MFYGSNTFGAVNYGGKAGGLILPPFNIFVFDAVNIQENISISPLAGPFLINVFDNIQVTDAVTKMKMVSYINKFDDLALSEWIKMKMISFVRVYDEVPTPTEDVQAESFIYSPSNFGPFGDDGEGD